jgi:predicted dehydrogenase
MSRKRGRIVLVGTAGIELSRADFFQKELSFQVSCSYGPGRYDPVYEEQGIDYPVGYVRWTEQRNFEAVLDMLADRKLDTGALISHRFSIADAKAAYDVVGGTEPSLGIVLEYPPAEEATRGATAARRVSVSPVAAPGNGIAIGFIGAGSYATGVLIPAFKAARARLRSVACSAGVSGVHAAKKFGIEEVTTETEAVFADPTTNVIVIATRHDTHADLVCRGLAAGKHVFVEKPLAIREEDLDAIEAAYRAAQEREQPPMLTVGFNRRAAPHVKRIKDLLLRQRGPKAFVMTINAGAIPAEHWTQDPRTGGGRIVGEVCHFVDLLRFLVAAPIVQRSVATMEAPTNDTVAITLSFADGSIGTVHYVANGAKAFPKERLEVFAGGKVLQLDNFRRLLGFGWPGLRTHRLWRQDKGQNSFVAAFVAAVAGGGEPPIPFDELLEVSAATIAIARAAESARHVG